MPTLETKSKDVESVAMQTEGFFSLLETVLCHTLHSNYTSYTLCMCFFSLLQAGEEQQVQIELPKSRPRPYGLVIPISTDADGSYISNILSASHQRRSTREVSQSPKQLYFNVTAFGREFHLRLKPNTRLVAPEAVVEWYEDSVETGNGNGAGNSSQTRTATERLWKREPLWTNCAYVGDITDIPGASVAISNCDGLTAHAQLNHLSG
uniref:Peptidase M12B propeptide domain-containing protein n=1 Tax=Meleagris gallopavo TaxID=9103 RepID=A0A803YDC0_MELGA